MSQTIIAVNQTVSDIILKNLSSIVVPGSGQIELSKYFTSEEIYNDPVLIQYVTNGTILFNDGTTTLPPEESLKLTTPAKQTDLCFLTNGTPDNTWDQEDTAGVGRTFFPGSFVQHSVTGVLYRCTDSTANNAIWRIIPQEAHNE